MDKLTGKESRLELSEFKLSTLLEITNAINNNLPEDQLFVLLEYILHHQLNLGKAVIFLLQNGVWNSVLHYGVSDEELKINVAKDLQHIKDITVIEMIGHTQGSSFDVVIPVFHQGEVIAYMLLGDIDENELKASPIIKHLPFIQTLANITAVAVENRNLVRESLKQERIKRELEMASEMQGMLLPKELPNNRSMQVSAYYKPHQEVGGDFYDVVRVSDNATYFCMADVSGKGMPAAILMASFQANLRANIQVEGDLVEIIDRLNQRVWANASGERFITLFLGKYLHKERTLEYINAAHPAPMIISKGEVDLLQPTIPGLGMIDELPPFEVQKKSIEAGDILFCYTDGVTELTNSEDELFEDERLAAAVLEKEFQNMAELNIHVIDALNQYRSKIHFRDDVALVSCRFF